MIVAFTPFAVDRNYGAACNAHMQLLSDGDWGVIMDHDMMWTTREWFLQIAEAVTAHPRAMFTAMTNRIAAPWQRPDGVDVNNHDVAYHRELGRLRLKQRTLLDVTHTKGLGGVIMVVSKAAWQEVGGFVDGLFCVDHNMHFAHADVGRPVYVMENLYVYHWRRAHGDTLVETPKAPCRCRGVEAWPTERISLP